MRFFGVLPKLPRVELTIRTPTRTIFENFNNFIRVYVGTDKGLMAIGNRSIPRVYLLPPGEIKVQGIQAGKYYFEENLLILKMDFTLKFERFLI